MLTLYLTRRHLLNQILNHYGNDFLTLIPVSIVMEYADNGDLFQKI